MDHSTQTCLNCNNTFTGKFCNQCGEKVIQEKDRSVLKFLEQSVDMFTHLDSKFLKSFIYLFTKPGKLTLDYIRGVRVRYAKPVQFFIVINALYFLVNHFTVNFSDFRTPLADQLNSQNTFYNATGLTPRIRKMVDDRIVELNSKISEKQITFKQYEDKFNAKAETLSKTFIFLMIPVFAIGVFVTGFRKLKYFSNALVYATHFYSFFLLYLTALCLFLWIGQLLVGFETMIGLFGNIKWFFLLLNLGLQLYYFWFSMKRLIQETLWKRILRTIFLFFLSLVNFVFIYRIILFYVTYYNV